MEPILYPAKVLLLGEYSALLGGESVAIPWRKYSGNWSFLPTKKEKTLKPFYKYFKDAEETYLFLEAWKKDIKKGLYFKSDIPIGYGVGSSGALVAAVFESYAIEQDLNLEELRKLFIFMESYFHGTSSGIDPLVSYLKRGIFMQNQKIQIFDYEDISILNNVYLWDTKKTRQTKFLVNWFYEQLENVAFKTGITENYMHYNQTAMEALIDDDVESWNVAINQISNFQYTHFTPMIPEPIRTHYKYILDLEEVDIKLCGAGGGGYYLLSGNKAKIEALSESLPGKVLKLV